MEASPKYLIASVTVSVSSKRGLEDYSSAENFTSVTFSKADGKPFTEQEVVVAAMEMSEQLRRKILLDEVAQGVRGAVECTNMVTRMSVSYQAIRDRLNDTEKPHSP